MTFRGKFTAMGREDVVIEKSSGESETISVANLKEVRFDQEPSQLLAARSNERSGAFDSALEKLNTIQSEYDGTDSRLKTEIEFLIARTQGRKALTDPSNLDAAIQQLQNFRTANGTNFRYLEASLLQAELLAAKGDTTTGKSLLQEVQASAVKGYQLQAGVQLGRLLLAAGDVDGALAAFNQVVSQSEGDATASAAFYDGQLGKALCLKQQTQPDQAIAVLDEVIAKASDSESRILAEAWVRKGDCLRQKNEPKAALMAYLHVDVLYSGETAQHAEALLNLSRLWGPSGHQDRAQDAAARLSERYPNSQFAKQLGAGG
ncbi:MAG: tetratricopeptide repeat protein [Planctomycetaceae bacterium]